jgi:hypothetical protein
MAVQCPAGSPLKHPFDVRARPGVEAGGADEEVVVDDAVEAG